MVARLNNIHLKDTNRKRQLDIKKEIDFYSFATKYAALHQPTKFPLFDSLVARFLPSLNRQSEYCPRIKQAELRNYRKYVAVIDALIKYTSLESYKYKRFDQGIWVFSKYLYSPANLTEQDIATIEEVIKV